jgi:RNA polymerase sigma-70 factor (ECF subfamily)
MSESQAEAERSSTATVQAWVEYCLPRGLAYARSLLPDRHAAEDVVHDCFCRLLAKRDVYDLPRDGFKLLLRSITNACIDLGRKENPVSNSLDLPEDQIAGREVPDNRFLQPPRAAMYRELQAAIGSALQRLPVQQRAALELKSLGCSLSDIAKSLSVTENYAGVLVHRARQCLENELGPLLTEAGGNDEQKISGKAPDR